MSKEVFELRSRKYRARSLKEGVFMLCSCLKWVKVALKMVPRKIH